MFTVALFTQHAISSYQEKRCTKRLKTQFEEIEPSSESDMAGMLELSEQEFKTTMIYMLRALTDKIDSM